MSTQRIVRRPRTWTFGLIGVVILALLACGVQTDDPTLSPAPASTPVPTRPPEVTRANQDVLLRHCIETEMRRGNISLADGVDVLSNLEIIRDPGDPYRLGLMVQCLELGYLDEVPKEDFKGPPTPAPSSMPATSTPYTPRATQTPVPTATASPTPTPPPNPLPAELTSGVDALVHCAGETVEYWLENGPPTLTADLVACLNAYLEQVEG